MKVWGKMLGGSVGLIFGGPVGLALGLAVGHQFDRGYKTGDANRDRLQSHYRSRVSTRANESFFHAIFPVLGRLSKADGRVNEDEIRVARLLMHRMELSPEQTREALELFRAGKSESYPLVTTIDELRIVCSPPMQRLFVEVLIQAVLAKGSIHEAERALLWTICQRLNISRVEFAQIEAIARIQAHRGQNNEYAAATSLQQAYRLLGASDEADDKEIKLAYRRLMSKHHPDKLTDKSLSDSEAQKASHKAIDIRLAYEQIKTSRGMK